MKLTNAQKRIFNKYALKYELYEKNDYESKRNVERQRYVYKKLKELQIENTNIEKLLDFVNDDIKIQYELKTHTESRVGFLLALWGIILGNILQSNLINKIFTKIMNISSNVCLSVVYICLLSLMIALGTCSLIMLLQALLQGKYASYIYSDKDRIYRSAVEDKEISMTILLDAHINIWKANEKINDKKLKRLTRAVYILIGFVCATILCYLI